MERSAYLRNPCASSSLPFWKTESFQIPDSILVVRDDRYSPKKYASWHDEPYFKLRHDLCGIPSSSLPDAYGQTSADIHSFAEHIRLCYNADSMTDRALSQYVQHPVYDPDLWLALSEKENGMLAASGIAELDVRIGEGILEWIQVSPGHRRKGLGAYIVCQLLHRMKGQADFATVSGRINSKNNPLLLYQHCGFTDPVIWHVLSKERPSRN